MVFGMCVGELFLGVELSPSFLENVLVRLVFSGNCCGCGVTTGGKGEGILSCWYISGLREEGW
jgi:hypothetical protein